MFTETITPFVLQTTQDIGQHLTQIQMVFITEILIMKMGDKWEGEDWIFTQWNGKLLNLATISAWWHDFAESLGIKSVTFHGLRHTAATYLIGSGVYMITTAAILGNAKPSTTANIYGHLLKDSKTTALEKLEGALMRNKNKNVI